MSEQNLIGLSELIEQVKQELLTTSPENEKDIPLLSVDSVELELQVTVKNEGKAGIKIYVLELGGGNSQDDVQKVKVTLSPLLNKEQMLAIYKKKYPERWNELLETSIEGGMKGNEQPGF
ncbi:trypco2 family protein [Calothrix sp. CCY 0018]|uniref:trypco2 family protein n=1 Tax=Calothrix sp. CCY 0018 TaxID=3103864 RepID=UPI0039C63933